MRIQLRKDIYTTIVGDTRKKACAGCAFFAWNKGICTALVPIYKLCCPPVGKVLQYSDTSSKVFDL